MFKEPISTLEQLQNAPYLVKFDYAVDLLAMSLPAAQGQIVAFIARRTLRWNKEREVITLEQFKNGVTNSHTGERIINGLRMARSSIIRNLGLLLEAGWLRKIELKRYYGGFMNAYEFNWKKIAMAFLPTPKSEKTSGKQRVNTDSNRGPIFGPRGVSFCDSAESHFATSKDANKNAPIRTHQTARDRAAVRDCDFLEKTSGGVDLPVGLPSEAELAHSKNVHFSLASAENSGIGLSEKFETPPNKDSKNVRNGESDFSLGKQQGFEDCSLESSASEELVLESSASESFSQSLVFCNTFEDSTSKDNISEDDISENVSVKDTSENTSENASRGSSSVCVGDNVAEYSSEPDSSDFSEGFDSSNVSEESDVSESDISEGSEKGPEYSVSGKSVSRKREAYASVKSAINYGRRLTKGKLRRKAQSKRLSSGDLEAFWKYTLSESWPSVQHLGWVGKTRGQANNLAKQLGDSTQEFISWAIDNWQLVRLSKFPSKRGIQAPSFPEFGFLFSFRRDFVDVWNDRKFYASLAGNPKAGLVVWLRHQGYTIEAALEEAACRDVHEERLAELEAKEAEIAAFHRQVGLVHGSGGGARRAIAEAEARMAAGSSASRPAPGPASAATSFSEAVEGLPEAVEGRVASRAPSVSECAPRRAPECVASAPERSSTNRASSSVRSSVNSGAANPRAMNPGSLDADLADCENRRGNQFKDWDSA